MDTPMPTWMGMQPGPHEWATLPNEVKEYLVQYVAVNLHGSKSAPYVDYVRACVNVAKPAVVISGGDTPMLQFVQSELERVARAYGDVTGEAQNVFYANAAILRAAFPSFFPGHRRPS